MVVEDPKRFPADCPHSSRCYGLDVILRSDATKDLKDSSTPLRSAQNDTKIRSARYSDVPAYSVVFVLRLLA